MVFPSLTISLGAPGVQFGVIETFGAHLGVIERLGEEFGVLLLLKDDIVDTKVSKRLGICEVSSPSPLVGDNTLAYAGITTLNKKFRKRKKRG